MFRNIVDYFLWKPKHSVPKLVSRIEIGAIATFLIGSLVGIPVVAAIGGIVCGVMGLITLSHYIYHFIREGPQSTQPYTQGLILAIITAGISILTVGSIYRNVILLLLSAFIIFSILSYQGELSDMIMNARICIRALSEINLILFIIMMLFPMTIGMSYMNGIIVGILTLIPTIMTLNWVGDRSIQVVESN